MEHMQEVAFKRAINALTALKCQFAIITPEGEKYGELNVAKEVVTRKHKQGEMKSYVDPYLNMVQVGDGFTVPCGEYDMPTTVRSVSNWFYKKHGAGSFNYKSDKYTNCVHGIRIK